MMNHLQTLTPFLLIIIIAITTINKVQSAPSRCDLKSIFQTPARRNYDRLEILERSNFDSDNKEHQTTPGYATAHPKSYANAQVLLRFGGGNPQDLHHHHNCHYCQNNNNNNNKPICACGRHCKCRNHFPLIYPVPVAVPVCFYYNHNPLKFYNYQPIATQSPLQITEEQTTRVEEVGTTEPSPIIPITNNHPEILQPIELTTTQNFGTTIATTEDLPDETTKIEEEEEEEEEEENTYEVTELVKELPKENNYPTDEILFEDKKPNNLTCEPLIVEEKQETKNTTTSEIVVNKIEATSYDPTASKEESNIKYVNVVVNKEKEEEAKDDVEEETQEEEIVSDGDLMVPVPASYPTVTNKKVGYNPIIKNSLLDLLVPRIVEELMARKLDRIIEEPRYHYSGYKMSAGSGYYTDPTKTVLYRQPTIVKVVKSRPEPDQVLVDDTRFSKHGHYHGKNCGCPYCAKYVRELNE